MMKAALIFACVLAFALSVVRADSDVVVLTEANFHELTGLGSWLTEFYAPWCGHCKHLAPTWEKLASEVKGEFHVGKVDCTVEKNICSQFGVRGYPTIKFLQGGRAYDYSGARSIEAFASFARDGFRSAQNKEIAGATQTAKQEVKEEASEVKKEAPKHHEGDVVVLTDSDFYSQVKEGVWMVKFYAPWCGHCKSLAPTWDALATKTDGKFKVAKIDCTTNRGVCEDFNIPGYPTLKLIKDGNVYAYSGSRSEAAFLAFVNGGYSNAERSDLPKKAEQAEAPKQEAKKDAEPAAKPAKEVIVLTDKDFDEKVSTGNWLVEFYAPWCGHCKHLAPVWAELATKVGDDINVAKVDCTVEKQLMSRFGIRGFPTIKYIRDEKVYEYRGPRDLNAFISFANTGYTTNPSTPFTRQDGAATKDKDEL